MLYTSHKKPHQLHWSKGAKAFNIKAKIHADYASKTSKTVISVDYFGMSRGKI